MEGLGERRVPPKNTPLPFQECDDGVTAEIFQQSILRPVMFIHDSVRVN